ncbi:MAG: polyisoprenoid-binding protein YceI [Candidatus Azotimanducaceae bacterium]|jgi:polyisoprenoid-binding protein YceI
MMKKTILLALMATALFSTYLQAADYIIDSRGAHASINFKIKHLGYSWLTGRFDGFEGQFSYDPAKPASSKISVQIDTTSISSNHAERDKHLKSKDFLEVSRFATATFTSTSMKASKDGSMTITGVLSLHGIDKNIVIEAHKIGEGDDPWGGYRAGFSGTTRLALKDFGINTNLGPSSTHVELELHVEGVRQ